MFTGNFRLSYAKMLDRSGICKNRTNCYLFLFLLFQCMDAILCYTYIPKEALPTYMEILCLVINMEGHNQEAWRITRNVMKYVLTRSSFHQIKWYEPTKLLNCFIHDLIGPILDTLPCTACVNSFKVVKAEETWRLFVDQFVLWVRAYGAINGLSS